MNALETLVAQLVAFFMSFNAGTRTKKLQTLAGNTAALEYCERVGALTPELVSRARTMTNKVAVFRLAQMLNFIASGDPKQFNAPIALCVCNAMVNDEGTRIAFVDTHFALAGTGSEDAKAIPHLSGAKIRKALGSVKPSTVVTQITKAIGKNGILTIMGATVRDAHGATIANKSDPLVIAYAKRLAMMPEGALVRALNLDALPE